MSVTELNDLVKALKRSSACLRLAFASAGPAATGADAEAGEEKTASRLS